MRALRFVGAVLAEIGIACKWPARIVGGAVLLLAAGWSTAEPVVRAILR